jgi:hypothetical protein
MGYMPACIAGRGGKLMWSVVVWDMDMLCQLPESKLQVKLKSTECVIIAVEKRKT